MILILLLCIGSLLSTTMFDSGWDATKCKNGMVVSQECCIEHGRAWLTEAVPVEDVHSIVIEPYSCANPSYCKSPQKYFNSISPGNGCNSNGWCISRADRLVDSPITNFGSSCGNISFIVCANTGLDAKNEILWTCYGRMEMPNIMLQFVHSPSCTYDAQGHLEVGSCVVNQETFIANIDQYISKPYVELSTPDVLSFEPFLNLNAINALSTRAGINRVIRKSDTWLSTAYIPPYPNDDARFAAFARVLLDEDSHLAIYALMTIAFMMVLLCMSLIYCYGQYINNRNMKALKAEILCLQESLPVPVGSTVVPVASSSDDDTRQSRNLYPCQTLDFFDTEMNNKI